MSTKRERDAIEKLGRRANAAVSAFAARGDLYSRGLAGEGYNGGYRDAMQDALLILRGVSPQNRYLPIIEEE